ncbi:restriction endonuclease subunit S [Bradyrhizobium sp. BR 10261]|uniref:restriction endonuclease subunit S n=1 Tax=Bradyrhizobium sp. BR 10261 TaxID=2749992 RepID=UPI001C648638|nr:restriction endonuclease subunit S [Bradyrhizobium sp. BR 10261]MBW7966507.1 restriction endonuclease subunit S [Bradyrhizobium sp. BR 10261]
MNLAAVYQRARSWTRVALGDILTLVNGRAYKQNELLEVGTQVIRIQNLNGGDRWYYSNLSLPEEKYCQDGDLLFAWSATFGPYFWSGEKAIYHYHIWKVIPSDRLDKRFAYYLLQYITERLKASGRGISMIHITKAGMEAWEVDLPPLQEQQRISAILDNVYALRCKRQRSLELSESLTKAMFLEMFGDPVQNENLFPWKTLGEIGQLDRGVSKHRPRNDPALLGGEHPLIQTGEVANSGGYITSYSSTYSDLGLRQSRKWPTGTLCITIAANIARTGILTFPACFPDSVVGFSHSSEGLVQYVRVWLSFLQQTLERKAPAVAQKNINLEILRNLPIALPPMELLDQFDARLKRQRQLEISLRNAESALDDLFSSLQYRAFSGQL